MKPALLLACFVGFSLFAAGEPLAPPAPGEDRAALDGKSAEEFFGAREKDTDCRTSYTAALTAWRREPSRANFDRVFPLLQRCGPCKIAEVLHKPLGRPVQNWYESSGRCFLPGNAEARRAAFQRLVRSLKTLKRYPARHGGFSDVVEFRGVDHESGALIDETDEPVTASPFYAFVAVRGPAPLGIETAASYYVKNEYRENARHFALTFQNATRPRDFSPPELPFTELELAAAQGRWYLDDNGYIRYWTAAVFPVALSLNKTLALRVLTNTLLQLMARAAAR